MKYRKKGKTAHSEPTFSLLGQMIGPKILGLSHLPNFQPLFFVSLVCSPCLDPCRMVLPKYNAKHVHNRWCLSANLSLYTKNDGPGTQFKLTKLGLVLKVQFTRAGLADLPTHSGVFILTVQPSPPAGQTRQPPPTAYAVQEGQVEDFSRLHGQFTSHTAFLKAAGAARSSTTTPTGRWLRDVVTKHSPDLDPANTSYVASPASKSTSSETSSANRAPRQAPATPSAASTLSVFSGLQGGPSPSAHASPSGGTDAQRLPRQAAAPAGATAPVVDRTGVFCCLTYTTAFSCSLFCL